MYENRSNWAWSRVNLYSIRRVASSILAWVRNFSLSRASMVSPPFKLKMFTGSVCVRLTSVSLKFIKIKVKLIYASTSSWEKTKWRVKGKWRPLILFFSFYDPSLFFYDPSWFESNFIFFLFDPSRSELIRSKVKCYSGCKLSGHFWKMNALEDSLNTDR